MIGYQELADAARAINDPGADPREVLYGLGLDPDELARFAPEAAAKLTDNKTTALMTGIMLGVQVVAAAFADEVTST